MLVLLSLVWLDSSCSDHCVVERALLDIELVRAGANLGFTAHRPTPTITLFSQHCDDLVVRERLAAPRPRPLGALGFLKPFFFFFFFFFSSGERVEASEL